MHNSMDTRPRRATRRGLVLLAATVVISLTGAGGHSVPTTAQTDSRTFPETGKTVSGQFLSYWQGHGGLAQQGFPISEEMQERSDLNNQTYAVQYFERAVFEKHPENQPPFDTLLSQLGTFQYRKKYPNGAPNQQASADNPRLFPETGQHLGGKFRTYWETHGGLAQQGFPISEEFTEVSDLNGQSYTVQYFERAVFELHPENQPPYEVLLSQLGTFQYQAKYQQPAATAVPTVPPAAVTPLREFLGHTGAATVAFSPDGKTLLTGSEDKTARLWDVASGQSLRVLSGHTGKVWMARFSFDGKTIATSSEDHTVRLWDTATGQTLHVFTADPPADGIPAFSPDGKSLAKAAADGTLRLWNIADGREVWHSVDNGRQLNNIVFSPDGQTLLTAGEDATARLWDAATGQRIRIFYQLGPASAAVFSPDGKQVVTADGRIRLFDTNTADAVRLFDIWASDRHYNDLAFSPDGRYLVSGGEGGVARLWDVSTGSAVVAYAGHWGQVIGVAISPDGQLVATGYGDGSARIWNLGVK